MTTLNTPTSSDCDPWEGREQEFSNRWQIKTKASGDVLCHSIEAETASEAITKLRRSNRTARRYYRIHGGLRARRLRWSEVKELEQDT